MIAPQPRLGVEKNAVRKRSLQFLLECRGGAQEFREGDHSPVMEEEKSAISPGGPSRNGLALATLQSYRSGIIWHRKDLSGTTNSPERFRP